jgi:type I restriction enzyme S subunit
MRKGWTETTLDGLIDLYTGKLDVNASKINGQYPFFTCAREIFRINDFAFDGKAVLVAGNGDLNVKYYEGKFNAYQRTYVLFTKDEALISPSFLFLYMSGYIDQLRSDTQGSTIQYLKKNQFTDAPINLPPLQEQKRIVDLISSVDSYIGALQQQAGNARKSRNAVLHELLSAGGDGWVETTLGEAVSYSIGGIWGDDPGDSEIDIAVYRQTEFSHDGILVTPADANRSMKKSQAQTRLLKFGDVLIQKSAGTPTLPGRVVMVRDIPEGEAVFSNFLNLIRADTHKCIPEYLFLLFWIKHKNGRAFEYQRGTNIKNLDLPNYLLETILLPPLQEQERIVDLISSMDDAITTTEVTIAETRKLRSGLLSDLLSGDHEIPASYDKITGVA